MCVYDFHVGITFSVGLYALHDVSLGMPFRRDLPLHVDGMVLGARSPSLSRCT